MSTRHAFSTFARLAVAAACVIATTSCGGELLRTGRGPVFLSITQLSGARGNSPGEFTNNLLSDVETLVDVTVGGVTTKQPTIFNDLGRVTLRVDAKNTDAVTSPLNAVTMTRYRVVYRRSDGRNNPGTDVPYPIEGGISLTIQSGSTGQVVFDLVRHAAKLEPPLRQLRSAGGRIFISTIAEITFYGRDQNGNEVQVTGMMDITFGDFGDED